MKKYLLMTLSLTVAGTVTAQEPLPYHPFLKEGKVWSCELQERIEETAGEATAYYMQTTLFSLRIDGDTLIGNKSYKKVYRDVATIDRQLLYVFPEDASGAFSESEHKVVNASSLYDEFLREEEMKVYRRYAYFDNEEIIYDFSLAQGDVTSEEYCGLPATISNIDNVNAQERLIRRFHLSIEGYTGDPVWVEGVGHPSGPCRVYGLEVNDGKTYQLLSCHEDGECIFTKDDFWNAAVINAIDDEYIRQQAPSAVYDLHGRRVKGQPTHGIYIQQGRKHVVK